jgi:hypothetical protein
MGIGMTHMGMVLKPYCFCNDDPSDASTLNICNMSKSQSVCSRSEEVSLAYEIKGYHSGGCNRFMRTVGKYSIDLNPTENAYKCSNALASEVCAMQVYEDHLHMPSRSIWMSFSFLKQLTIGDLDLTYTTRQVLLGFHMCSPQ